jgi:hypothetical protein
MRCSCFTQSDLFTQSYENTSAFTTKTVHSLTSLCVYYQVHTFTHHTHSIHSSPAFHPHVSSDEVFCVSRRVISSRRVMKTPRHLLLKPFTHYHVRHSLITRSIHSSRAFTHSRVCVCRSWMRHPRDHRALLTAARSNDRQLRVQPPSRDCSAHIAQGIRPKSSGRRLMRR